MRSTDEATDTFGKLPPKTPATAPAPASKVRQVSEHVVEVDGKFETRDYPNEAPKRPSGWACRLTADQLAFIDLLEC